VGRIALALGLLVVTGCGGTSEEMGVPVPRVPAPAISGDACRGKAAPHTSAEVVAALHKHGFTALAPDDCEAGQRPVNALLGDGLAGEENAVYCSVAATPAAQRPKRFNDQVRQDNVFCVTHSPRVHERVVAALRELPR
jgi:hypothetical protein